MGSGVKIPLQFYNLRIFQQKRVHAGRTRMEMHLYFCNLNYEWFTKPWATKPWIYTYACLSFITKYLKQCFMLHLELVAGFLQVLSIV